MNWLQPRSKWSKSEAREESYEADICQHCRPFSLRWVSICNLWTTINLIIVDDIAWQHKEFLLGTKGLSTWELGLKILDQRWQLWIIQDKEVHGIECFLCTPTSFARETTKHVMVQPAAIPEIRVKITFRNGTALTWSMVDIHTLKPPGVSVYESLSVLQKKFDYRDIWYTKSAAF